MGTEAHREHKFHLKRAAFTQLYPCYMIEMWHYHFLRKAENRDFYVKSPNVQILATNSNISFISIGYVNTMLHTQKACL